MAVVRNVVLRLGERAIPRLLAARTENVTYLAAISFARCLHTSRRTLSEMKFTKDHEWIKIDSNVGRVGVTDYAQEKLGEVVYVDLPEVGRECQQDEAVAAVESVKAASDIISPASGEIIARNELLESTPSLVNDSPYENGWIFDIKLSNTNELSSLMSKAEYETFLKEEDS